MDTEGCELGPFTPAPDMLLLAAIERAACHGTPDVWVPVIGEHLGFKRSAHNTRRLRHQLERIRINHGWIASRQRHGQEHWRLTTAGCRKLMEARRAGGIGELPEAPQHRTWRLARAAAADRIDGFRSLLYDALQDAGTLAAAYTAPPSATWFEQGARLAAAFWLVGSATHCLEEWAEPDDVRPDTDTDPGPAPGRRAASTWNEREAMAKEASK